MMTNKTTAKATLDELRGKLAQLDLPGARKRLEQASAEWEQVKPKDTSGPGWCPPGSSPEQTAAMLARDKAAEAKKRAKGDLQNREAEDAALRREISHLEQMLGGETRLTQAQQAVDERAAALAAAKAHEDAAAGTLDKVERLIADEAARGERGQAEAGAQILAALKAGADAPPPAPSGRDLTPLTVAKAGAEDELAAASAALQAAKDSHAAALREVDLARADVTELAYRFALDGYLRAAVDHLVACAKSRRDPGIGDARSKAMDMARPIIEQAA